MLLLILKLTACSGLFLLFYKLFLEREKMFRFNRYYLLVAAIFSCAVPFLTIELPATETPTTLLVETEVYTSETPVPIPQETSFNSTQIWLIMYVVTTVAFFIKMVYSLYKLHHLKGDEIMLNGLKVVQLNGETPPFSFWNKLYVGKTYLASGLDSRILRHEEAHIKQMHSLDLLLIEFLTVLFWFNPALYIFKKLITNNHEYLADEAVLKENVNLKDYQRLILDETINAQSVNLSHSFNFNNTKKRFNMMTAKKNKYQLLKKWLVLPIALGTFALFVDKTYAKAIDETSTPALTVVKTDPTAFTRYMEILKPYTKLIESRDFEGLLKSVPKDQKEELIRLYSQIEQSKKPMVPMFFSYIELNKSIPTIKQFNSFKNPNYQIILDGKIVDYTILEQYKNTDFMHFYDLKVLPKNPDYGKFEHSVSLATPEYFKSYNAKKEISVAITATSEEQANYYKEANAIAQDTLPLKKKKNEATEITKATNNPKQVATDKNSVMAEYPGGVSALRKKITDEFDVDKITDEEGMYKSKINFVIDKNGEVKNFNVEGENPRFNKIVHETAEKIAKVKWNPAIKNGEKIESHYSLPITMHFEHANKIQPEVKKP